jgi:hypothetical protein
MKTRTSASLKEKEMKRGGKKWHKLQGTTLRQKRNLKEIDKISEESEVRLTVILC